MRTKTNWKRFDSLTDSDVHEAVKADPDAAPILDAACFRRAKVVMAEPKTAISFSLGRDVVE